MPCYHPLEGYYSKDVNSSGRRSITFNRHASHSGSPVFIPCGRCVGCRLERARQWSVRCMHEARMHKHNWFVTLTYSTDNLPENGFLVRRDTQLFMKRLRKVRNAPVRVYGCAEYGTVNKRPHYHLILFNCDFPDKKFFSRGKREGEILYTSDELRSLWPLGHNVIGDVTPDSARYVAGYVLDKVNGKLADDHYMVYDSDGVVHVRPSEFSIISRGSAIGSGYYEKFGHEIRIHDNVIVDGVPCKPPRIYDKKFELTDVAGYEKMKRRRKSAMRKHKLDNTPERLDVKERLVTLNLKRKKL